MLLLLAFSEILFFEQSATAAALVRLGEGMAFGVAQVALGSTLLNDLTVSEKRTVSDYYFAWIALCGIPAGIAAAYWLMRFWGFDIVLGVSIALVLFSMLIVGRINVPFRAPINVKKISCDRI